MPHKTNSKIKQWGKVTLVTLFAVALFHVAHTYRTFRVPSMNNLLHTQADGVKMYDRHGDHFYTLHANGRRTNIPFSDIPDHTIQALIAAEDQTFYKHFGISPTGIVRAAYKDIQAGELLYGGSTITQQLTKMILLNPHKNLDRKYREAVYSMKIEYALSKEEILEIYLNNAYFGEQAYGIEEAAQTYFRKPARELTVAESALIIGVLPAPSALSPISGNAEFAKERQKYVLQQMIEEKYLTLAEAREAFQKELAVAPTPPPTNTIAHHFALTVYKTLEQTFTPEYLHRSGMHVYTTLDPAWQRQAEETLNAQVDRMKQRGASNGAAVVIDVDTHEVRALVGSVGWHTPSFGRVNMATAPRQTGSAFKPIAYAAALESGQLTAASLLIDQPTTFGTDYKPENYDRRYRGRVTARYALANSLNIPAVAVTDKIGPATVANMAEKLGISTLSKYARNNLSIALGTEEISVLELTNAYSTFADNGAYQPPQIILRLEDKFGRPLTQDKQPKQQALRPETSFIITSMLSDNSIRRQTFGNTLVTNTPSASKTGTTQDFRDAWTVGYTPHIAVGVWIGNSDSTPMRNAPGATTSAPVWRELIDTFSSSYAETEFKQPESIVQRYICPRHGLLAASSTGGIPEYFIPGTEPTRPCPAPSPEKDDKDKEKEPNKNETPPPKTAGTS